MVSNHLNSLMGSVLLFSGLAEEDIEAQSSRVASLKAQWHLLMLFLISLAWHIPAGLPLWVVLASLLVFMMLLS